MFFKCLFSIFLLLTYNLVIDAKPKSVLVKPKLRFNDEGKLKIVNFADLHYGEYPGIEIGRTQDLNSTRVITDILNFEKPDLVVFTGDLITGDSIFSNSTGFIETMLQPLREGNYRWASTYGNHDNGIATTREQIFATEKKYDLCYTQHGPEELPGVTNYYLPIYPTVEGGENENPIFILWFFDSQGGFDPSGVKPSIVHESVVAWFEEKNRNFVQRWGPIPALAFFHIPTTEYRTVQADIPTRPDCVGLVDEAVVAQDRNTGLMEALVNSGTVLTTFVGHDHDNAWCCTYKTMEICYNRHTGYGGYGSWTRGARVVELDSSNLKSNRRNYIRLENGTIIDEYPAS